MDGVSTQVQSDRLYCYAVARGDIVLPEGLSGVADATLVKHSLGSLSLVLSKTDAMQLRPQRKFLSAHYRVLSALSAGNDILPMAFGIIFDDLDASLGILREFGDMLSEQLDAVSGSVEIGLRLKWQGVDVFTVVVDSHADLQQMRNRCFKSGNPSQRELLDLGQAFEKRLNQDRDKRREVVLAALRPVCRDIRVLPVQNETTSVNVACLVERKSLDEFDKAIESLAGVFDDNHLLELDGPLPPFNFVDVRI